MTSRVLITGIGGFAGGYLSPLLAREGFEVTGLVQGEASVEGASQLFAVDLRDYGRLCEVVHAVRPTHVVHLAAITFVGHDNLSEICDVNIVGSKNLLNALSRLGQAPEAVLLVSSANIYGNSDRGVLFETDPANPANDYAISKVAMEYVARQFANLNIVIARPFNYTGRGQSSSFLVPKIVSHFRERRPYIELGNIDVSRDFSDVRTVAAYFSRLLQSPAAIGGVYNICSGAPHSLEWIIQTCEHITGHTIEVRINPAFVRAHEIKSLVGSTEKLHRDLGIIDAYPMHATLDWMLSAP